jgi:hypothetical protein
VHQHHDAPGEELERIDEIQNKLIRASGTLRARTSEGGQLLCKGWSFSESGR